MTYEEMLEGFDRGDVLVQHRHGSTDDEIANLDRIQAADLAQVSDWVWYPLRNDHIRTAQAYPPAPPTGIVLGNIRRTL